MAKYIPHIPILHDAQSIPHIPILHDAHTLDIFSPMILPNIYEQQKWKIGNKMSPAMQPKSIPVPALPTISSIPIQQEYCESKTEHRFDAHREGPDFKIARMSAAPTACIQLQPKHEDYKLSLLADLATSVPLPLKK